MKKIINFLILISVVAFFSNCNKNTLDEFSPFLDIELESKVINMFQNGGYDYIPVRSNIDWKVTCSASWLMVDMENGKGSKSIKIETTDANTDEEVRTATVTVKSGDGGISHSVQVTQLGLKPTILLNVGETHQLEPIGGIFTIIVTASGPWSVGEIVLDEDELWLKDSIQIGRRKYFQLDMNATGIDRSTNLTFYLNDTDLEAKVEVIQKFLTKPVINRLPAAGQLGKTIRISGKPMSIVTGVLFGGEPGVIDPSTRTNSIIDVTIPKTAPRGNAIPVTIIYGTESFEPGTMRLFAAPEVLSYTRVLYLTEYRKNTISIKGEFLNLVKHVTLQKIAGEEVTEEELSVVEETKTETFMEFDTPKWNQEGFLNLILYYDNGPVYGGKIRFTRDLALYTGSLIPGVPVVTRGNASGSRYVHYAFDGIIVGTDYNLFDPASPDFWMKYSDLYAPSVAADPLGQGSSYWQFNSSQSWANLWGRLDYGSTSGYGMRAGTVTFDRIVLVNRDTNPNPGTYRIDVSDDGTTYIDIVKPEDTQPLRANLTTTHTFDKPITARYVRYTVLTTVTNSNPPQPAASTATNCSMRSIQIYKDQ